MSALKLQNLQAIILAQKGYQNIATSITPLDGSYTIMDTPYI